MLHHYITKYTENNQRYAESWIQINAFGKSVRSGVLKSGIGVYLKHLSKDEANEQGFTDIMLKVQKSRPKELMGLKPDFKIPGIDGYVVKNMLGHLED